MLYALSDQRERWTSADVAVHSGLINYSICLVLLVNKQSLHICSGIASPACLFALSSSLSLRLTRNYDRDLPDALARPSSQMARTYLRRRRRGRDGRPGTFLAPREDGDGEGEIRGDDVEGKRRRDVEGRLHDAGDSFIGEGEGFRGQKRIRQGRRRRGSRFAVEAARGFIRVRDP